MSVLGPVGGQAGRRFPTRLALLAGGDNRPLDALISANSLAAESLSLGNDIGSIAAGMQADIIAVEGNPLEDITAVRNVVFVMKGGRIYKNTIPSRKGR